MIKLILVGIAIYVVYKLFANDIRKKMERKAEIEKQEQEEKVASGEMVQDPECGTYVSLEDSISVRDGEKIYCFCSYDCRDKFLKKLAAGGHTLPGSLGAEGKNK